MAEGDDVARRAAAGHVKPRHQASGGARRAFLGGEFHLPLCGAVAQAGEGVGDDAQAVCALQAFVPCVGLVAVHLAQKAGPGGAAQHALHFGSQAQGVLCRPGRQYAGMHAQHARFAHGQGAMA